MKILMISNMYPSEKFPSYGVFIKNFETALIENGLDIEKAVMTKTNNKIFKLLKYIGHYINVIVKILFHKYDVIYVNYVSHNAIPVLIASRFKKIKIYANLHGSDLVPQRKSQEKFQKYTRKILLKSKKVVVPSNYFKNLVNEMYTINKDKIVVYESGGVNTKKFSLLSEDEVKRLKCKYKVAENSRIIGYVGRIDTKKGWDVFLKSINELSKNGKLEKKSVVVVGGGGQISEYLKYVNQNNLDEYIVHFDLLAQEELSNMYNIIDIFIFPTLGESLGLVGLEAMYSNCAIVGSDIGALREYIFDGKNGYKFTPGNSQILSRYINDLLNMTEEKFVKMKLEARMISEKYTSESISKKIKDIF